MAKRKVDLTLLPGLLAGAENQEIVKGVKKTYDSNFPIFATPVNTDVLVYIPRTNVEVNENLETMRCLEAHVHDYNSGKSYGQFRCINGLTSENYGPLGYDGDCPLCEATKECWSLYNLKLAAEAARLGVDPQNDAADVLKSVREKILKDMALKNLEEFVVFPVVLIPLAAKMKPTEDALEHLTVQFVVWKKQRYEENILAALETMMENPGHPAGLFWMWKFSYDTKGKQATARDSAKNAKYTIIQDAKALEVFEKFRAPAEDAAKDFTLLKAQEVVVAVEFLYKEDIEKETNKIMSKTRQLLAAIDGGNNGVATPLIPTTGTNPLLGIGATQTNLGVNTSPEPGSPVTLSE